MKIVDLGHVTIYGDWDDTHGYQFIVNFAEAGAYHTVLTLGGYDYGGGVQLYSNRVPYKELNAILDMIPDDDTRGYAIFQLISDLVKKYEGNMYET